MSMNAFYGEYKFTMDPKNRIFIPSKFREALKSEKKDFFMITNGLDKCLYIFLPSRWEELINNNMEIFKSENKEEERAFKRFFFSRASECSIDEQGRILIQQAHREYAGLKKEIVITGVGNKAEIWDARNWNIYTQTKIKKSVEKFNKILDI